jgi:hypothetical protein
MQLAPVLNYNYHHRGNERVWGNADFLPPSIRGQAISRGTIDEIVHQHYSDFDPSAAQAFAVAKQADEKRFLGTLVNRDPQRGAAYQQFHDVAAKITPAMRQALDNPALYGKLATLTDLFRQWAVNMSEQDPTFLAYYNRFYLPAFGPIEQVAP